MKTLKSIFPRAALFVLILQSSAALCIPLWSRGLRS